MAAKQEKDREEAAAPPEQSEDFKRGQEARARINKILEQTKWLQKNMPEVHFIFACTPALGVYVGSWGGIDEMAQAGLLEVTKAQIVDPVARRIEAANKPKPSGLVHPTGAPIPMTHSQR